MTHPYIADRAIPEPNSGCYLWAGSIARDGYGRMRRGKRVLRAHRASYEMAIGPIPGDLQVLHKCDVPSCVNADHLFLGTHADNMADKASKGRVRVYRGEASNLAVLTEPQALAALAARGTHQAIADRFGVDRVTITNLKSGRTWAHLRAAA